MEKGETAEKNGNVATRDTVPGESGQRQEARVQSVVGSAKSGVKSLEKGYKIPLKKRRASASPVASIGHDGDGDTLDLDQSDVHGLTTDEDGSLESTEEYGRPSDDDYMSYDEDDVGASPELAREAGLLNP